MNLKYASAESTDFSRPLRPLLYVKTRWGSTLTICKMYLKIQDIIACAHQSLFKEQGRSASSSIDSLSVSETILIENLDKILENIDALTELIGKSKKPKIQDVDVITATVLCGLSDIRNSYSPSVLIDTSLRDDILRRRVSMLNQYPTIGLLYQVSTFLTPV